MKTTTTTKKKKQFYFYFILFFFFYVRVGERRGQIEKKVKNTHSKKK